MNFSQTPIPEYFTYFHQRRDACGLLGFTIIQKVTSAIRQLAYAATAVLFDEYLHTGEQTAYDCLNKFCKCIFHLYATEYLRKPTAQDVQRSTTKHAQIHRFPGMLGSINCMHWRWRNCPARWKGHYTRGDHGYTSIMLEAVASYDGWFWHAFFGTAGSNNDINVLNQSDLFNDFLAGEAPPCTFTVNGCTFDKGYYLADGIYPEWSTLVKSFRNPIDPKQSKFKNSSCRFIDWYDPPMCARSVAIIPGLLEAINRAEAGMNAAKTEVKIYKWLLVVVCVWFALSKFGN
ncbi:uncharacterized protein [Rutidosis leptorrhynchoides]|uniref:uncharacterized protein n=1 Tax=Rutidosis leptorrhynchoides TaxID=125765 RepID=UPI003A99552F